jgi:outer membrane protein OmpA-like peptidoglycan-associated protein
MLMPEVGWPPEIDFNETRQSDGNTIATLHYTSADLQIYRSLNIDLAQWHTWGVVWTPTSLTYTVDGQAWGIIDSASEIPDQPMHLDITQQTWCSSGFACPTAPESTQVDWVEEYKPTIGESAALGPFAPNSWALTPVLKAKIVKLAVKIKVQGDNSVALVGYNDDSGTAAKGIAISRIRARVVGRILKQQLAVLGVTGVSITTTGKGDAQSVASNATPKGRARNRRVVPWIM